MKARRKRVAVTEQRSVARPASRERRKKGAFPAHSSAKRVTAALGVADFEVLEVHAAALAGNRCAAVSCQFSGLSRPMKLRVIQIAEPEWYRF
jgi:hypothetical protein